MIVQLLALFMCGTYVGQMRDYGLQPVARTP